MKSYLSILTFATILTISWASVSELIPSATFISAPQLNSAIVHTERVGPNFAYSTFERHGYPEAFAPIVQNELYHFNAAPLTLPTAQYVYLHSPFISSVEPNKHTSEEKPKVEKPKETEVEKFDDDTVSIESA